MSDDSYYDEDEALECLHLTKEEVEEENNQKYLSIIHTKKCVKNVNIRKEGMKLEQIFLVADTINMNMHNDQAFKFASQFMKELPQF